VIPALETQRSRRPHSHLLPEVVLFGLCFLILWLGVVG